MTGAGSGIGRASALRLAEEGGSVLAVAIAEGDLADTGDEITRASSPSAWPGEPWEIANVVHFPASVESSFMTGSVADGGMPSQ